MVPLVVKVPPVIGPVVATLVTVPEPPVPPGRFTAVMAAEDCSVTEALPDASAEARTRRFVMPAVLTVQVPVLVVLVAAVVLFGG
jgi:hypothetical protein